MTLVPLSHAQLADTVAVEVQLVPRSDRVLDAVHPASVERSRPGNLIGHELHLRFTVQTSPDPTDLEGEWLIFTGALLVDFLRYAEEPPVEELRFVEVEGSELAAEVAGGWSATVELREQWPLRHYRIGFPDLGRFDVVCTDLTRCTWPRDVELDLVHCRTASGRRSQAVSDWSRSQLGLMALDVDGLRRMLGQGVPAGMHDPATGQTLLASAVARTDGLDDERVRGLLDVLLDAGADPAERGGDGRSAAEVARGLQHQVALALFAARLQGGRG